MGKHMLKYSYRIRIKKILYKVRCVFILYESDNIVREKNKYMFIVTCIYFTIKFSLDIDLQCCV